MLAIATAGLIGIATSAIFTGTDTITANTFSTGSVNLTATPALTMTNMAPGDTFTAPITVTNTGTLQQRYAVSSVTGEDIFASQLDRTLKSGVTACTNGGFATDGTSVYAANNLGSVAGTNLIGDPAAGAQGGERVLNAAGSEILCAQVELPLASGNGFQGLTTTAVLTFSAEQTINN